MNRINALRGHTSIYFTDYIKENITDLHRLVSAKGFSSFNGYVVHMITEDLQLNGSMIVRKASSLPRPDFYEDSNSTIQEKLKKYTDGQMLDLLIQISNGKNIIMQECTKRGMKV